MLSLYPGVWKDWCQALNGGSPSPAINSAGVGETTIPAVASALEVRHDRPQHLNVHSPALANKKIPPFSSKVFPGTSSCGRSLLTYQS